MTNHKIFLHKLCIELGYKSILELENSLSYRELMEWQEYYSLYPFQADRIEIQLARLTETLLLVNGNKSNYLDYMITIPEDEIEKIKEQQKQQGIIQSLDNF